MITLDVGGTSADIGLAQDGKLRMKHLLDTKVGPYQAMIPMVDVDTIGAGGGSIAYVDAGGIFRVGPRSAGAAPGPVAYDRGGTEPTATDAHGRARLAAARSSSWAASMGLREDLAREAIDTHLAGKLGTSIEEAAMGVYRILVHSMVDAIEQTSVRKGFDPRDFVLVAEGGGGPLFAPEIAPEVGVKNVLVPSYPGITAALGLLTTDMVYEYVATSYAMASSARHRQRGLLGARVAVRELQDEALAQFATDGIAADRCGSRTSPRRATRARATSCASTSPAARSTRRWIDAMKAEFHDIHEREYSRRFEDADVQIANVRVRAVGVMPGLTAPQIEAGTATPPEGSLKLTADAWFRERGELEAGRDRVLRAHRAARGQRHRGPRDHHPVRLHDRRPAGLHVHRRRRRQPRHHLLRGRPAGRGTRTLRGRGSHGRSA